MSEVDLIEDSNRNIEADIKMNEKKANMSKLGKEEYKKSLSE